MAARGGGARGGGRWRGGGRGGGRDGGGGFRPVARDDDGTVIFPDQRGGIAGGQGPSGPPPLFPPVSFFPDLPTLSSRDSSLLFRHRRINAFFSSSGSRDCGREKNGFGYSCVYRIEHSRKGKKKRGRTEIGEDEGDEEEEGEDEQKDECLGKYSDQFRKRRAKGTGQSASATYSSLSSILKLSIASFPAELIDGRKPRRNQPSSTWSFGGRNQSTAHDLNRLESLAAKELSLETKRAQSKGEDEREGAEEDINEEEEEEEEIGEDDYAQNFGFDDDDEYMDDIDDDGGGGDDGPVF